MKHLLAFFTLTLFLFSCTDVIEVNENEDTNISGKYNTMRVVGDYIYAVTDTELVTIDKSDNENPQEIDRHFLGGQLENLYVADQALFIGSETDMHIFELKSNGLAELKSSTQHVDFSDTPVQACDPAIAEKDIAYVTISTEVVDGSTPCGTTRQVNELKIYDVAKLSSPILLETLELDSPQGLAIDGDLLFVTNLNTGTDIYKVDHQGNISLENHIEGPAHDVIAVNNKVMIVSKSEINQYDYSNVQSIIHYGTIAL